MSEILVENKQVVIPGEELAKGMDYLPGKGTYRDNDAIVASKMGLVSVEGRAIKLIPLQGQYLPKRNDVIIGQVIDVLFSGWRIETNSAYSAMLSMKDATSEFISKGADLTQYYAFGDYVVAKITNVTSQMLVDLTMRGPGLKKLQEGRIINVVPNKVPRIIGKQGSMVSMIKEKTGCQVVVGQNGLVWISGAPDQENFAVKVIKKIEQEAHISGLTDRIKEMLEKEAGSAPAKPAPRENRATPNGGEQ